MTCHFQPHPIIDTCWNARFDPLLFLHSSCARACLTRIGDHLPSATTVRAVRGHTEKATTLIHLPLALTGRAGLYPIFRLSSRPMTCFARNKIIDDEFFFCAACGLFKSDTDCRFLTCTLTATTGLFKAATATKE